MLKNLKLYLYSFFSCFFALFFSSLLQLILLQHKDVEVNPGPRKAKLNSFSCCHWNVSLISHKMAKLSQMKHIILFIIMIWFVYLKNYFDSSISVEDTRIQLDVYSLIRADHPSNKKRGGISIYYKESLDVKVLDVSFMNECILCEVLVQNKRGYVADIYRSPSQNNTAFDVFLNSFDNLLNIVDKSSSLFTVILGDFNARSTSWWVDDKTTTVGTCLEAHSVLLSRFPLKSSFFVPLCPFKLFHPTYYYCFFILHTTTAFSSYVLVLLLLLLTTTTTTYYYYYYYLLLLLLLLLTTTTTYY